MIDRGDAGIREDVNVVNGAGGESALDQIMMKASSAILLSGSEAKTTTRIWLEGCKDHGVSSNADWQRIETKSYLRVHLEFPYPLDHPFFICKFN
jgi:hypothetical protein